MTIELDSDKLRYFSRDLMCPTTGIACANQNLIVFPLILQRSLFLCKGLGTIFRNRHRQNNTNKSLSIKSGGIVPIKEGKSTWIIEQINQISKKYNFELTTPINKIPKDGLNAILFGIRDSFKVEMKNIGLNKVYNIQFEGIINFMKSSTKSAPSSRIKRWASDFMRSKKCKKCKGGRFKPEALNFRIDNKNITDLANMDIVQLKTWLDKLEPKLSHKQQIIAKENSQELKGVQFLIDVGREYLNLNRSTKTLSGGESQRIRLATQIGSQLTDVLYILDEPSIGLHQRDNQKLIQSLKELRDLGESIIVVEHDKDNYRS